MKAKHHNTRGPAEIEFHRVKNSVRNGIHLLSSLRGRVPSVELLEKSQCHDSDVGILAVVSDAFHFVGMHSIIAHYIRLYAGISRIRG